MATTPEKWLPVLAKRIDDNMPRVRLLARYSNGDAPLPELSRNTSAAWRTFQREARTNWGLMIRDAVADRIIPNGITVGGASDSDVAVQAQRIWRDNRMDSVSKQWLKYGLDFGESFLTGWQREDGTATITADSPETMGVAVDPLQPWRIRAAMRWWRDLDDEADYAIVWSGDSWQKFRRPCFTMSNSRRRVVTRIAGQWEPVAEPVVTHQPPPVVVYRNPDGLGEVEPHMDAINRINRALLQLLSTMAIQAFRQRALETADGPLPKVDENGNAIDYASIFEACPGALWELPKGVKVWESEPTDFNPMLSAIKEHVRQLASATKTPLPMMMPDNANQSAQGAIATENGYIFKCWDRLAIAKVGLESMLVKALQIEGVGLEDTVDVSFESPERVTLAEKYSAASQAKAAGESWASIRRNILHYSQDQIRQDDIDRAREQLSLFTSQRQADGAVTRYGAR